MKIKSNAISKNPIIAYFIRNGGILLALLLICVILSFLSPYFLTSDNLIRVMKQTATMAIVTFGMSIVLISGEIDLSVGAVLALSGCVSVTLFTMGVNSVVSVIIGILLGGLVGFINGFIISRTTLPSFIVTLGTQNIARGCAYLSTGGLSKRCDDPFYDFLGNGKVFGVPFLVIMVGVCLAICWVIMNKTVFGRGIYARGSNREAARYAGIKVSNICLKVFIVVGLLSGVAGVLMAGRLSSAQPTVSTGLEGDCIASAVLGGTAFAGGSGTIGGAFLGVLLIGIMNNGMNLLELDTFWQMIVKGIVIILAIYIDMLKKNREKR